MIATRLQLLANDGAAKACRVIDHRGSLPTRELTAHINDAISVDEFLRLIISFGLVSHSNEIVSATREMRRSLVLADAVDGGDLDSCINTLRQIYPALDKISIVRKHMTRTFLKMLFEERAMGQVSICSPWINLSTNEQRHLKWLTSESARLGESGSLTVVTRAPTGAPVSRAPLDASIAFLKEIGAEVIFNNNVHAKVYIRIPGLSGGAEFAVIGSENLTIPKYLELGLLIRNDSSLINNLVGAFFEIVGRGL